MAIDIDAVLVSIGEFGTYQRRVYFLLCLPIIFVGAANLSYVFLAATPLYRCIVPNCDNKTDPVYKTNFLNFTLPLDNSTNGFDECHHYKRKIPTSTTCLAQDFSNEVEKCTDGIVFDKSVYQATIITEFDLTCENGWKAPLDQSIYFAGILVGSAVFGILSDVIGRRKTILISIVSMSSSGVAVALVPNLISLHIIRFINAISTAGLFQTAFVLGMEFVGPGKRVMFGILGNYFFALGEIILGLTAMATVSWRMLQLIISTPVVCFIFYYWIVPESVRWLQSNGKHVKVIALLEKMSKINKKTIPLNLLRHQPPDNITDTSDDFGVLICDRTKVTMLDIMRSPVMTIRTVFMIVIWIVTTLTYYGLSYNSVSLGVGSGPSEPYVTFMLSALAEVPGYTLAWVGMSMWDRRWSLISSLMFAGASCIASSYVQNSSGVGSLVLFLLGKCTITCAFGIIYVFTAEIFPTSVRNTVIGICSMFARIGGMLAPFSNSLSDLYQPLPLLLFGVMCFSISLLTLVMPETVGTKLPDTILESINLGKSQCSGLVISDPNEQANEETDQLLSSAEETGELDNR